MYLNCKDFSMLTGQTGLPPNQPTSLKMKNVHNVGIFQPFWLRKTLDFSNCGFPPMFLWRNHSSSSFSSILFLFSFFLSLSLSLLLRTILQTRGTIPPNWRGILEELSLYLFLSSSKIKLEWLGLIGWGLIGDLELQFG